MSFLQLGHQVEGETIMGCSNRVWTQFPGPHSCQMFNHKGGLVARVLQQQYRVVYVETFAPIVKFSTFCLFALVASKYLVLYQRDVKTAFWYGDFKEIVMKQPLGYKTGSPINYICKQVKALHGLTQARKPWLAKFNSFLCDLWFQSGYYDPCFYVKGTN